jgi:hypothetical protein
MSMDTFTFRVHNRTLFAGKWPPNELLSLFRESERHERTQLPTEDNEEGRAYVYECPVGHLVDRLEIMGFTLAQSEEQMDKLRTDALNGFELRCVPRNEPPDKCETRLKKIEILTDSRFEDWLEAYVRVTDSWLSGTFYQVTERGPLDHHLYLFLMEERDAPVEGVRNPFEETRFQLRAMLATFRRDETATLDYTPMVIQWDFEPSEHLAETATDSLLAPARRTEPIVVLTEGRTDTRILSRSLEKLYPHLAHLYTFLDYGGFGPQPGTGGVGNLYKGLAGCRISNRVIALFDNDAAGTVAMAKTKERPFPANFLALQLPTLELAQKYPTVGPTGPVNTDINGLACGIELYLGAASLTGDDGLLTPIQWTGFERQLEKYQGELRDKEKVQERYLQRLEAATDAQYDPQFENMRTLFRMIFRAFVSKGPSYTTRP